MSVVDLSRLFNPSAVVLVGATDRSTWSKMAFDNLKLLGFEGQVYVVNRSGGLAHGQQAFKSAVEIGKPVDLALLMVPIVAMADALSDLNAAGIRHAVVLAGGFAETGQEGRDLQDQLVATARGLGISLLGPNCMGFINFNKGAACWTGSMRTPPLKGGISIVSQSGALATVMMHFAHQHGIGLNVVASTGNEAVLGLSDVLRYLVDDAHSRVIAIFAETVRDTPLFREALARALHLGKPVVILKVGCSDLSALAAQSHTGSMVGDDHVFDGVCRQFGAVRVRSIEELVFTAALFECTGVLPDGGVAVLSASGGMGELAADYAHLQNVELPTLAPTTLLALKGILPPMASPANPLDLTGAVVNNPDLFRLCMEVMQDDPAIAVLVCIYDVPTANNGDWAPFAVGSLQAIGQFQPNGNARFLVVSNVVKMVSDRSRSEIEAVQLPYLPCGLDISMRALHHALDWSVRFRANEHRTGLLSCHIPSLELPKSEREAIDYLKTFGVPVVPQVLTINAEQAVQAARSMNGPVVLKISSPDIAHKTEVSGVLLNLNDEDAVTRGFNTIMDSVQALKPLARIDGILVSPMRKTGLELFVGIRIDPQWGPVIAVGLGGIWIEMLKDVSLRLLPISIDDVKQMLSELRGAPLLDGFRGGPAVDITLLADAVKRIGDAAMGLGPTLDTLEVNPLLATSDRIEALDALATYNLQ